MIRPLRLQDEADFQNLVLWVDLYSARPGYRETVIGFSGPGKRYEDRLHVHDRRPRRPISPTRASPSSRLDEAKPVTALTTTHMGSPEQVAAGR